MFHDRTATASKGKWRGILLQIGVPEIVLHDKHGPCPLCGGADRFRWDNKDGRGSYICSQCGAGDGMKLAMSFTGQSFPDMASQIDGIIGNIKPDTEAPRVGLTDEERRIALRAVWSATAQAVPGDLADKYLTARGVGDTSYPKALRFGASLRDGDGGVRPCMVAIVSGPDGKPVTLHRTFLRPDGLAKAEMPAPRKLMPGKLPDGACVMLSEYSGSGPLGVAEGVETALSASALYSLPVWAAINSNMLAKWSPPDGCDEVAIFGDNDPKFGGQAAAFALAHRLAVAGILVTVHIPTRSGCDWNDIHLGKKA